MTDLEIGLTPCARCCLTTKGATHHQIESFLVQSRNVTTGLDISVFFRIILETSEKDNFCFFLFVLYQI